MAIPKLLFNYSDHFSMDVEVLQVIILESPPSPDLPYKILIKTPDSWREATVYGIDWMDKVTKHVNLKMTMQVHRPSPKP